MRIDKEKEVQKERILARIMSKEISEEQLKRATGAEDTGAGFTGAGTCTIGADAD